MSASSVLSMPEGDCEDRQVSVAALIISIVAILVAGVAAYYTRRQSRAADVTAANDSSRRHDELTPRFSASLVSLAGSVGLYTLRLHLEGPQPLSAVSVRLLDAPRGMRFTSEQAGVAADAPAPVLNAFAVPPDGIALRPYEHSDWQFEITYPDDFPVDGLKLLVDANAGEQQWQVRVPVPLPDDWVSIW
jgi:hypothetical protein